MGAGAMASAGGDSSFDEVPESNSPPRERRQDKAAAAIEARAARAESHKSHSTRHSTGTPSVVADGGGGGRGVRRRRKRPSRRMWWRDVPPTAFTLSIELDQQLDQLTTEVGVPREQYNHACVLVVRLADALGVPVAKRDEWAQASEIPPVVRFRRVPEDDPAAAVAAAVLTGTMLTSVAATANPTLAAKNGTYGEKHCTKVGNIRIKRTPISSLCENLRLLDSGDSAPAAKRALLKMTLTLLLGGTDERGISGEKLKAYCQRTRIRVFRFAAYDIGLIEDDLCFKIRDNERFQEELGPLMRIIESGEKLDPSAKRAILRAIMRDAKSPKQVTSPVKRAAEEVGEMGPSSSSSSGSISSSNMFSAATIAASAVNTPTTGHPEENKRNGGGTMAADHLVHTRTLIALLSCLEDVARMTPAEIRALLAHLFSVISVRADLDSFVDFVLDARLCCVWKAALQSGLVMWDDSRGQYSFMHSVLGTGDIGISWPNE
jgi:hypothetical protein